MLLGSALPPLIARIAQRVGSLGLAALLGPDLAERLDGKMFIQLHCVTIERSLKCFETKSEHLLTYWYH